MLHVQTVEPLTPRAVVARADMLDFTRMISAARSTSGCVPEVSSGV